MYATCIYIYIERERETDVMCTYIYTYIHIQEVLVLVELARKLVGAGYANDVYFKTADGTFIEDIDTATHYIIYRTFI